MTTDSDPSQRPIPDGLLWHYTDFAAFKSIVEKGAMWASNLEYLSDAAEFKYTLDLIRKTLQAFETQGLIPELGFGITAEQMFRNIRQYMRAPQESGIYVTCFSREKDDLGQWRAYGSAVPAFSIGFNRDLLTARVKALSLELMPCLYELSAQEKTIKDDVQRMFDELQGATDFATLKPADRMSRFYSSIMARHALGQLTDLAATGKDPAFSAEKEERVVKRIGKGPGSPPIAWHTAQYRQSRSLVVPYIEWPLREIDEDASPIKCVVVGPGPHRDEVAKIAERMCRYKRVCDDVRGSKIPFRNW